MSLIPALGTQKQVDLYEFKASQVYISIVVQPGLHNEVLLKDHTFIHDMNIE